MDIYTLPDYLNPETSEAIQLFDYQSSSDLARSKINLTQNTISFLQEGTKEVVTHDVPVMIEPSHFLIMKSGHCLMTEKISPARQQYHSLLLFFSDELLWNLVRKHGLSSRQQSMAKPVKACQYDDFIRSFIQSLQDLSKLSKEAQTKLLPLKLEEIVIYLAETQGTDFLHFLTANTDDHTKQFIRVVESNSLNKLTLKELAFLSNMSVSTFKREFEKHFKESPSRWFQQKRLEHSAQLLQDKSVRPTEIYEEIGYESLSNFIQAFKSRFGVTPKQYQLQSGIEAV